MAHVPKGFITPRATAPTKCRMGAPCQKLVAKIKRARVKARSQRIKENNLSMVYKEVFS
jgi:hypothetical protein